MVRRRAREDDLEILRSIAAFQWDWSVARSLFPPGMDAVVDVRRGRIRHVIVGGRVYVTLRPNDNLLSPGLEAGEAIRRASRPPAYRVVVRGDREIRGGVLARDVSTVDPGARPGDEVLVVDEFDRLLGVGRLRVPPVMVEGLSYGEVVRIRSRVR